MTRWHNHYPDGHAFFCTYTVQEWSPKLDDQTALVLYEEWEKARQALGVRVLAYCVMPNHVHIILWSELGENVRKFLHRTIAQTSRRLRPGGGFHASALYPAAALTVKRKGICFHASALYPAAALTVKRKGICFAGSFFAPKHRPVGDATRPKAPLA